MYWSMIRTGYLDHWLRDSQPLRPLLRDSHFQDWYIVLQSYLKICAGVAGWDALGAQNSSSVAQDSANLP